MPYANNNDANEGTTIINPEKKASKSCVLLDEIKQSRQNLNNIVKMVGTFRSSKMGEEVVSIKIMDDTMNSLWPITAHINQIKEGSVSFENEDGILQVLLKQKSEL